MNKKFYLLQLSVLAICAMLNLGLASSIQIGKVNNSDALIALVHSADGLLIYVCGGDQNWASHTSWFSGAMADDDTFSLAGQDGLSISGKLAGSAARGQLILADGKTASWQSMAVTEESLAGLYRFASETEVAGFIVADSRESVGSIRLIRPAAAEVLPLRLESELGALALSEVVVCYFKEATDSCLTLSRLK